MDPMGRRRPGHTNHRHKAERRTPDSPRVPVAMTTTTSTRSRSLAPGPVSFDVGPKNEYLTAASNGIFSIPR